MIVAPYYFWLAGSDTYTSMDANSEIVLTALPAALQDVREPDWVQYPFINIDPFKETWLDKSVIQAQIYQPKSWKFIVPDDTAELEKILAVFRYRYLYLCMDGELSDGAVPPVYSAQPDGTKYPERWHTVGSCICVEAESYKARFKHELAARYIDLKLRKKKPII
ncbi:MAG: hypothetical protein PF588_02690 [Candidatus Kapabacteria bacterium]|jgi:hypothetical protein|nr:hypothetical protein [Candidatus Kapabacteria bacterium]